MIEPDAAAFVAVLEERPPTLAPGHTAELGKRFSA
jgi:hypothetical protein